MVYCQKDFRNSQGEKKMKNLIIVSLFVLSVLTIGCGPESAEAIQERKAEESASMPKGLRSRTKLIYDNRVIDSKNSKSIFEPYFQSAVAVVQEGAFSAGNMSTDNMEITLSIDYRNISENPDKDVYVVYIDLSVTSNNDRSIGFTVSTVAKEGSIPSAIQKMQPEVAAKLKGFDSANANSKTK